jgi:DNA polymerase V
LRSTPSLHYSGWIGKHLGVLDLRLVRELRGLSCFSAENCPSPKRGIAVLRMFGRPVESLEELCEAVAACAARPEGKSHTTNWQDLVQLRT